MCRAVVVPFVAPLYLLPLCKNPVRSEDSGGGAAVCHGKSGLACHACVCWCWCWCTSVPCTACVISEKQTGWNSACPCVRASVIRTLDLTRARTGQLV